jgi:IS30 family transposase
LRIHIEHQPVEVFIMSARVALSLDEREQIVIGIARNDSGRVIAAAIGRDPSVVNREIARNGGRAKYSAVRAQRRTDQMRSRPKTSKLESDPVLAAHVDERLRAKDSPMTISIELARGTRGLTASISHETIYLAAYAHRGIDVQTHQCLHLKRRRRKHRKQQQSCSTHSLGSFQPISKRPAIALQRIEVGHFEGDLITGAYNRSAKITMFDRASRRLWLRTTASKSADDVYTALVELLDSIPVALRRTLTWDQGSELARHLEISELCDIGIYICDKNAPWQRPTNENGNAIVRRWVGNGTDLNQISPEHLAWIEYRINTIPRRSLNWDTALNVYDRLSALTP